MDKEMVKEQFLELLEKEDESGFLSLLQSLTPDQKKEINPIIKKYAKEYSQFGLISGNQYGNISGTDAKRNLLQLASFVCFNLSEYEKSPYAVWILNKEYLEKIVSWYCPIWFSDFVNKQVSRSFIPYYLDYEWIMELTERGYVNPAKELVAKTLPPVIFSLDKNNISRFVPENLSKRIITLEEHIWYLFEIDTNINYCDRYIHFGNDTADDQIGWIYLFKEFVKEKRIDRLKILKNSLLASNRNFNKTLSGWFSQLFNELEPTKEEVVLLQKEIISVLSSSHSKPVNTSLNQIKKIAGEKEFTTPVFLDSVPFLLASNVKTTTAATIQILEKIAQKNSEYREKIVLLTSQVFIHADEDLQSKAAKLIVKFGDVSNETLKQELAVFYPSMLITAKQLLVDLFPNQDMVSNIAEQTNILTEQSADELQPIPAVESIDDLVFLASQAFDNNEPWHIDILITSLVRFRSQLTDENIPRFEAAFQRAFGILTKGLRSVNGYFDHLLAIFFIDFGNWLIKSFPVGGASINKIFASYDSENEGKKTSWKVQPASGSYTANWTVREKIEFYQPYKKIVLATLEKIQKAVDLPVLSAPTHLPCWIAPEILVSRLHVYQQAGQAPDDMDLQVAISRCYLQNTEEALRQTNQLLWGEFKELMIFLLDEKAAPVKPFTARAAWMVASLTKKNKQSWQEFSSFSYYKKSLKNYTGELNWESVEEEYTRDEYRYDLKKSVPVQARRKQLRVHHDNAEVVATGITKIFSKLLPVAKDDPPMLYEFLFYKVPYLLSEFNDIKRVLSLTPNNAEPILADTINQCLKNPEFWGEDYKKMVIASAKFLYDTWNNPGEMTHLFLSMCMLNADKTVINIGGEIWLKAVSMSMIDNAKLGKMIGLHERIELAPLKRFTDLATQSLFRVSSLHNQQLQQLVEHILIELPGEPVKNLKKLLEIYSEIIGANNTSVSQPDVSRKLQVWKQNAGLQKVTKTLTGN